MLKELTDRVVKEVKATLPAADITAGDAVKVTIATLQAMSGHLREHTLWNKAKFFDYTVTIAEELLTEVPGGTE